MLIVSEPIVVASNQVRPIYSRLFNSNLDDEDKRTWTAVRGKKNWMSMRGFHKRDLSDQEQS